MIWLVVIALGRGIGFTKGYNFEIPDDVHIQMEFPQQETAVAGLR